MVNMDEDDYGRIMSGSSSEADLSLNPTADINENKITNNENIKIKISDNSNQTQNIINNNNKEKTEIENIDNNKNNENIEQNKKEEKKISMAIHSRFKSANSQYVKNNNTLSSNKSKGEIKLKKENEYVNKNKELLNPLIHFTNLSSKKLKI